MTHKAQRLRLFVQSSITPLGIYIVDAGHKIKSLLSDKARLARMGRSAQKIGHLNAAVDIARDILKRHESRMGRRAEQASRC